MYFFFGFFTKMKDVKTTFVYLLFWAFFDCFVAVKFYYVFPARVTNVKITTQLTSKF
jgi:hypothetical protein